MQCTDSQDFIGGESWVYFSEQSYPASLPPPISVGVHQLLEEILPLIFPTLPPCSQAPIQIQLLVYLGRLKLCSSLDKGKVEIDNATIESLKFNFQQSHRVYFQYQQHISLR